ncbi:MAG: tetratricopeptide repeat protein [Anaerolineae bacterium]
MEPDTIEARPSPLPQIILILIVGIISLAVVKTYVIDNTSVPGVNKDGVTARPVFEPTRAPSGAAANSAPPAAAPGQAAVLPPPISAGAAKVAQPPAPAAAPQAAAPAAAAPPSAAGKAALAATAVPSAKGPDPEGARVAANAGNEAVQRADLDAAIQQFTKAVELDPVGVYFGLRGNVYWRMKNLDAALADYNRAVELDPQNADNYFGRAHVYKDMNKADQARQDVQVFLDLKPNTPGEAGIRQEAQQMLNDLP